MGNILLSRIMGAEVELVRSEFNIGVKESWQRAIDEVRERGGRPYPIPAGASDHPLGGLGFAELRARGRAPGGASSASSSTTSSCAR